MFKQVFKKPDWLRIHKHLPVFRYQDGAETVFYVPGHILRVKSNDATAVELALNKKIVDTRFAKIASQLLDLAKESQSSWQTLVNEPFKPESLTLYLTNRCNLNCTYCYSRPKGMNGAERIRFTEADTLTINTIADALELLVSNCANKDLPLTVVFHGGGEPTMSWALLQKTVKLVREVAAANDLDAFLYIASHGVMVPDKARWLGDNFNIVGLSCDGMPMVQQIQRASLKEGDTNPHIERTAQLVRAGSAELHVRITVMPESLTRQRQMVEYVIRTLCPNEIRLEPAYKLAQGSGFHRDDAPLFLQHFLDAKKLASQHKVKLVMSGVRHDEIHGPYCNVLRNSLQLLADGTASNCFLSWQSDVYSISSVGSQWRLNHSQIDEAKRQVGILPNKCQQCPNIYHCARDCPDQCFLNDNNDEVGFRCALQQLLTENLFQTSNSSTNTRVYTNQATIE